MMERSHKIAVFAIMISGMAIAILLSSSMRLGNNEAIAEQFSYPNELTGPENEVIKQLKEAINAEEGTFIFYFETGCAACQDASSFIFEMARDKELTVLSVNLSKYKKVNKLKGTEGQSWVQSKDLPLLAYYNGGWAIAHVDGVKPVEIYNDFFKHFQFGMDHDHDHVDDHDHDGHALDEGH